MPDTWDEMDQWYMIVMSMQSDGVALICEFIHNG